MSKTIVYKDIKIDFVIPAFDINKQGLIANFTLYATSNSAFEINTSGAVATSLERSFLRVVEIISSLNVSWRCLERYQYTLMSVNGRYKVKDARSTDLALCIAALNVIRNHKQQKPVAGYTGTGILRVDGSFSQTSLKQVKEQAVLESGGSKTHFISVGSCAHIFDLEVLLNNC